MFNTTLHLAPSLLVLFMAALAIVPLALIWADNRRREPAHERLARLRDDATLRDALARRAGETPAPRSQRIIAAGE